MYTTKECAVAFQTSTSKILYLKKYLLENIDYTIVSKIEGIIWKESAINFFKEKFEIPHPIFNLCNKVHHKKDTVIIKKHYELSLDNRRSLEFAFDFLPDGSYMLSELYEMYSNARLRPVIPKENFKEIVDLYCKTFEPIVTKRAENFYDKGVDSIDLKNLLKERKKKYG